MKHKRVRNGILFVAFLAVFAHLLWWYRPGERSALPSAGLNGPGSEDEVWIWMPFPHLNLSQVKESVGDSDQVLGALTRLAGYDSPGELPTFGPFALPPASDLVLAVGKGGERLRLEAWVDPVVAIIARLAGEVAGNPWLAGGEIETSNGKVKVQWTGNRWLAYRGGALPGPTSGNFSLQDPALAAVVLSQSSPPLPAGTFVLRRHNEDLEMVLQEPGSSPAPELLLEAEKHILFLLEGASSGAPHGLMLFSSDEQDGIRIGSRALSLPGVAVMNPPGISGSELPGEKILRLIQSKPVKLETASWDVVSYTAAQANTAAALMASAAPRLLEAENGRLEFALSVRPAAAEAEIGGLLELLTQLPLTSKKEQQRWRDAHRVLLALAGLERITVVSGISPPSFRLVLYPVKTHVD